MSFDGVREAHDRYRRLPDGSPSFDRLLPKLRMLLAARPFASVLMVVNPDTAPFLTESVSFLLDEGCRYVIVSLNYAGPWGEAELEELGRQYRQLADLYIEWTRQGRKFYLSPFEVKLSSHIQGEDVCKEHCELGIRQISVDPLGNLFPCVQFTIAGPESRWCIGNVVSGIDEGKRNRLRDESQDEKEPCRHRDPPPLPQHVRLPELADDGERRAYLAGPLPLRTDDDPHRGPDRRDALPRAEPAIRE